MAENKVYLAVGEEATRGTAESSTVGFVPLMTATMPTNEPDDIKRKEFRGEDTVRGDVTVIRMSEKWSGSFEMPFFTEGGTVAGIVGTIFKHFFGDVTTAENASTGQFLHMMYPNTDPFLTAQLGTKALTMNMNLNEGVTVKNWPYIGGRVTALTFAQEAGQHLVVTADMIGQKRDASATAIASPTYAAENLRADYNNMTLYTGTITRTGTGPDFTDFSFGSATTIKPDSITVKIENGMEDVLRLGGLIYPDKTRMGIYKVTIEFTLDWEDPASGFSSADDLNLWYGSSSSTNFFIHWDTGTQAGTGDNHSLYLDIPIAQRVGGDPEYDLEKDPMITLNYEGLYDATTAKYILGLLLKNTATAV